MTDSGLLLKVRRRLPPANEKGRLEAVSKEANISFHTLLKIVTGETSNPRIKTVEKLLRWAERQHA
jgi:predicted transcriptional regulator